MGAQSNTHGPLFLSQISLRVVADHLWGSRKASQDVTWLLIKDILPSVLNSHLWIVVLPN